MSEHITNRRLVDASDQLQRLVRDRATGLTTKVGFGYRPSPTAPTAFDELQREYTACSCSGLPLRVSSEFSDRTVIGAEFSPAFRFWHDLTHVALDQDFTRAGEIAVGAEQLRQAELVGHGPGSLPWRLLFAETIGQTECAARLGSFPEDQVAFTWDYLDHGLPDAIRLEARRQHLVIRRGLRRWQANEVVGSRHHRRAVLGTARDGLDDAA